MRASTGAIARRALATVVIGVLLLASTGGSVSAAEFRNGDIVTIGANEIIDDDLYIAGNTIVVDGAVTGDLISAASNITINGSVGGSVNAAGGTVNVAGKVGRAIRMIGGTLHVSGSVGGDLLAMGSEVKLARSGAVGGDVVLTATSATLDGAVGRNVKGSVDDLAIAGPVGGDVELQVDRLVIKDGAAVQGNLVYTSRSDAHVQPGSQVSGQTVRKEPTQQRGLTPDNWLWTLLLLLWAFSVGAVLVLLAPRPVARVADTLRHNPLGSLTFGFLALILAPLAAFILAFTLVGLPLAGILLAVWLIVIYLAQVFVGLALGQWLMRSVAPVTNRWSLVPALAVGLLVLTVITAVPVPFIGLLAVVVTVALGTGALVLALARLGAASRGQQTP